MCDNTSSNNVDIMDQVPNISDKVSNISDKISNIPDKISNISDHRANLEILRKMREDKYLKSKSTNNKKLEYNYDLRRDILENLKKYCKYVSLRDRMDKIEKQELINKFSKIQLEDLKHLDDLIKNKNEYFIIELFKNNFCCQVLSNVFEQTRFSNHQIIKEALLKPKIDELFILDLIKEYVKNNKNIVQIITSTNLLDTNFNNAIDYVLNEFYNSNNLISISFDQLKLIYSKTTITPDKLKFLIAICSNKSGYTKCEKTGIERSNIVLLKNMVRDVEQKFKCKINIDLHPM